MAVTLLFIVLSGNVRAASPEVNDYRETLARMLADHKRVAAAQAEVEAADAGVSKAQGAWYPDLALSSKLGHHTVRRTGDYPEANLGDGDLNLSVRQPLWDFGQIGGAIGKSEVTLQQSKVSASAVRMDLLLEGIVSFINLDRTGRSVEFARQSVNNIRRQTGLEQSRVEIGGGSTSDVLQA